MSESVHLPYLVGSDGEEVLITGSLIIGRSSECSLQIDDTHVSRQHARLEVSDQQVMLIDLGSHNGTWVNDKKITGLVELHDGDRIRISKTEFIFKAATTPFRKDILAQPPILPAGNSRTVDWQTAEPMTLVRGDDGAEFGLNRRLHLGRDKSNDLVLKANTSASQFHARIELLEGQAVISDLKSRNGTWVNGKHIIGPTPLKHGDKIRLGDAVFRLRVGDRPLPPLDAASQPVEAKRAGRGAIVTLVLVVCLVAALIWVWPSQTIQTTPTPTEDLEATQLAARQDALRAVVLVIVPSYQGNIENWDQKSGSSGSGSLLTKGGVVLTNFHVVGNIETGKYYNPDGLAIIGINRTNPQASPDEFFRCEIAKQDSDLDLAVLRVTEAVNETSTLDGFTPIPVGDSDKLKTLDL